MADEVTNISEIKTTSDGSVKISIETYNDLLAKAAAKPAVINRTTIIKTPEMASKEYRVWGGTFTGVGATLVTIGALLYRVGRG